MRLNQFIARQTGMSRRKADEAIREGRIQINEHVAHLGAQIEPDDAVTLDGHPVATAAELETILLHKPVGYICSRDGQGGKTVYDLLPSSLHHLKSVGRLDKDSSGLLLLSNDGQLTHELTHPSFTKEKIYEIRLDKPLKNEDKEHVTKGVKLEDGVSKLKLSMLSSETSWQITMHEGRNRQIRRTFEALGYRVKKLHRTQFGNFNLNGITSGKFEKINI